MATTRPRGKQSARLRKLDRLEYNNPPAPGTAVSMQRLPRAPASKLRANAGKQRRLCGRFPDSLPNYLPAPGNRRDAPAGRPTPQQLPARAGE